MNRRQFLATGTAAAFTPFLLSTEGCDNTTIAEFVTLIGNYGAELANFFGQSSIAGQITSLASQIAVDITNFQSGASAADAIQAINDLIGLINSLGGLIPAPYGALAVLLLSALTGLLALLPQSVASALTANSHDVIRKWNVAPMQIGGTDRKHASNAKKQLDSLWKAQLAITPLTK
jgi:hypothetical protein